MKRFLCSLLLLLVAACSLDHQQVVLAPTLENAASQIGRGHTVHVSVTDGRESKLLGYRIDETKDRADITAANDLATVVRDKVSQILRDNGFQVVNTPSPQAAVFKIDIRELAYKASGKYVAPSVETRALFKATAQSGRTTMTKDYKVQKDDREALPLTAKRNSRIINDILSEVLTMVAEDRTMMEFLTKGAVGDTGFPD